ncbi:MAG: 4Fe-4S dicluster domain-containing protein [Candidatus Melainabacteria bacterium]|jgi:sulfhydrogenase subunit beta (sulfur reductase)|nr:4Fe-4S dicluster domain-containing protein [Candidatus Melainabacteria bacterium]
MAQSFVFSKADFDSFFRVLQSLGEVSAPIRVSDQSFAFKQINDPREIAWDALRTILPPKKFFYPPKETLLTYKDGQIEESVSDNKFQVIFGVHPCDLHGLGIMDTIFEAGPADTHYLQKRNHSLIVGLSCMPDKFCFCQSMGTSCATRGYDLFLTDLDDDFFLQVETPAGSAVLPQLPMLRPAEDADKERYKDYWLRREKAFTNGFAPDNLRATMDMEWNNSLWDDLGKRCLSCGNCTPVCPTCYCFDLVDIASLSDDEGSRVREWDSCQFVGFAQVAGDYNFRPSPVDRLKFWYRHKLHGFDDAFASRTCVGCGRCTVSCPAGIDDLVQVVKTLQGQKEGKE